jgi:hypothetical protein
VEASLVTISTDRQASFSRRCSTLRRACALSVSEISTPMTRERQLRGLDDDAAFPGPKVQKDVIGRHVDHAEDAPKHLDLSRQILDAIRRLVVDTVARLGLGVHAMIRVKQSIADAPIECAKPVVQRWQRGAGDAFEVDHGWRSPRGAARPAATSATPIT